MNHTQFILTDYSIPKIKKKIYCKFQNLNPPKLLGMNLVRLQKKA